MQSLSNALYFAAMVLFTAVMYVQTLRNPPPNDVRANWPLRTFWIGSRLRHVALALVMMAALAGVVSAIGGSVWGEEMPYRGAILVGGAALAAVGALAFAYSVALYWQPPAPRPDGF